MKISNVKTARLVLTILISVMLIAASGCLFGQDTDEPIDSEPDSDPEITVTDDRDEEVSFDEAPQSIVSIGPYNTEILYGIGARDQIVGVDQFSDWPEHTAEVENVGELREPNLEVIAALEPDAVIISHTTLETIENLEDLDIPVLAFLTENLAGTYETIERIGQVTGRQEQAERLVSRMQSVFSDIQDEISDETETPKVYYEISPEPIWTAGADSFIDELIEMAGGENLFSDLDQEWAEVSSEEIIERDPDVIITTLPTSVDSIMEGERPGWEDITAVEQGNVYAVDDDLLSRPGPRLIFGFLELTQAIWPDRLSDTPDSVQEYKDNLMDLIGQ